MNKRNTEGYVLAYLLIVIAVMGAIAATLMTSTVQVMASQQNSIRYMQDKYEAMGEVEKLVAELDVITYTPLSNDGTVNYYSSDSTICYADAVNYLWQNIIPALKNQSPNLDITWNTTSPDDTLLVRSSSTAYSAIVNTTISFSPQITTPQTIKDVTENIVDKETGEITGTKVVQKTFYTYSIDIGNIVYKTYKIAPNGGDT